MSLDRSLGVAYTYVFLVFSEKPPVPIRALLKRLSSRVVYLKGSILKACDLDRVRVTVLDLERIEIYITLLLYIQYSWAVHLAVSFSQIRIRPILWPKIRRTF